MLKVPRNTIRENNYLQNDQSLTRKSSQNTFDLTKIRKQEESPTKGKAILNKLMQNYEQRRESKQTIQLDGTSLNIKQSTQENSIAQPVSNNNKRKIKHSKHSSCFIFRCFK
jgi:hypothetical protein